MPAEPATETPSLGEEDESTQASRAASEILRMVASMELPPGAAFTERELAELIGVARAPVREALLRIRSYDVVQARPGSGYLVTPITLRRARALLGHSAILLSGTAAAIVSAGPQAALVEFPRDHVDTILDAIGGPDVGGELLWTHLTVLRLRNEVLAGSWNHLGIEMQRLLRFAVSLGAVLPGESSRNVVDESLSAGDPWAAAEAATTHVQAVEAVVLRALLNSNAVQDQNLAG